MFVEIIVFGLIKLFFVMCSILWLLLVVTVIRTKHSTKAVVAQESP
jgi:hypothetical protein